MIDYLDATAATTAGFWLDIVFYFKHMVGMI
jgi:hypothetical protein